MAGIYIHIPFCKKKCSYCDFFSISSVSFADDYIKAIGDELKFRINEVSEEPIKTIYIGGGTPSQLTTDQLSSLITEITNVVNINEVEEFTIEMNPDDVTPQYMECVKSLGINRVSIGIQSFIDKELEAINRRHTAQEAQEAVRVIKKSGIDNISIDLIYGLPGQDLKAWGYNVNQALSLDIQHISAYSLSYEEGTRLYLQRELGKVKECSEELFVDMYNLLIERLRDNGFEHYEVSNFAKVGYYSRHNKSYWEDTPYIGLGTAAHSYDGRTRRYNPSNIKQFINKVNEQGFAYETEEEDIYNQLNDYLMTRLRTKWGVEIKELQKRFGKKLTDHFLTNISSFVTDSTIIEEGGTYRLSESGVMLMDSVLREVFYVE